MSKYENVIIIPPGQGMMTASEPGVDSTSGDPLAADGKVAQLAKQWPRHESVKKYTYGTAGFRTKAILLESVFARCGMLSALRSLSFGPSSRSDAAEGSCVAIGAMVTASHNDEPDNGIKMVDPDGGMLHEQWEVYATDLANAEESKVCDVLRTIAEDRKFNWGLKAKVFVGRDTRPSSPHLCKLLIDGVEALGGEVVDLGIVTTPQLHWCVAEYNEGSPNFTVADYYKALSGAFRALIPDGTQLDLLTVDCANGVGMVSLRALAPFIKDILPMELRNTNDSGLNENCGAEHVQKGKQFPAGINPEADSGKKLCSVDGDADRLVYYFSDDKFGFNLLDGDKIIALCSALIVPLVREAGLTKQLTVGVVQTAYANGASTNYITNELKIEVQCAKTGVKHLHHVAASYDVGIYFEANGHGTVMFSAKAKTLIAEAAKTNAAAEKLNYLITVINQSTGDAVSDILLVEIALCSLKLSLSDWAAWYSDLPSRMLKVAVKDRTVVKTANAERTCTSPKGLQGAIDELVAKVQDGRSFVRPSGTEDVVRVYAEGNTQVLADQLADDVKAAVSQFC